DADDLMGGLRAAAGEPDAYQLDDAADQELDWDTPFPATESPTEASFDDFRSMAAESPDFAETEAYQFADDADQEFDWGQSTSATESPAEDSFDDFRSMAAESPGFAEETAADDEPWDTSPDTAPAPEAASSDDEFGDLRSMASDESNFAASEEAEDDWESDWESSFEEEQITPSATAAENAPEARWADAPWADSGGEEGLDDLRGIASEPMAEGESDEFEFDFQESTTAAPFSKPQPRSFIPSDELYQGENIAPEDLRSGIAEDVPDEHFGEIREPIGTRIKRFLPFILSSVILGVLILSVWIAINFFSGDFYTEPTPGPTDIAVETEPVDQAPTIIASAPISELVGTVQGRGSAEGSFNNIPQEYELPVGGEISTGTDAALKLDFSERTYTRLGADTEVALEAYEGSGDDLDVVLNLHQGRLWVVLGEGKVSVNTANGTASVSGSYMSVDHSVEGGTRITCLEGTCQVSNNDGQISLEPGKTIILTNINTFATAADAVEADLQTWVARNPEASDVLAALSLPIIQGTVWADLNGDGIRGPRDDGMADITVTLFDTVGEVISSMITNSAGAYVFSSPVGEDYSIGFELPEGYVFTSMPRDTENDDSNVDPTTGRTEVFSLAAADEAVTINAGLRSKDTIAEQQETTAEVPVFGPINPPIIFTETKSDGLPANNITAMLIAPNGTLWAGTKEGLVRYANGQFTTFTTEDGLSSNEIYSLAISNSNVLYVGNLSDRIDRFDGQTWTSVSLPDDLVYDTSGLLLPEALLAVAPDGSLWLAADNRVAHQLSSDEWVIYSSYEGMLQTGIQDILVTNSNVVWVAGQGKGVSRYNGTEWTTFSPAEGFPANKVNDIAQGSGSTLWFATTQGAVRYDGTEFTTITQDDGLARNNVYTITVARDGSMWVGTPAGVSHLVQNEWTTYSSTDGLANNAVKQIVVTNDGTVWFATSSGISRLGGERWERFTSGTGLASNDTTAIEIGVDGSIWVSTTSGISRYDGEVWESYTTDEGLLDNRVEEVTVGIYGKVWAASAGGVARFDGEGWVPIPGPDNLAPVEERGNPDASVADTAQGSVWFGTWGGVSILQSGNWIIYTAETDNLPSNIVNDVLVTPDGTLWIATSGGVASFNSLEWTTYTEENGLASNDVTSLTLMADGTIWASTWGGGVSEFNGERWRTYNREDGLADDRVYSISSGPYGYIYFATAAGASRFNGETWETFTTASGLASNTVTDILALPDGEIWFATSSGVTHFRP
ncbi:MAG: FecR domain-containing protein, partial [Anaerolineales bacterium]|nr:FecR domain-containing protein [Anaerolineales bacterium]